MIFDQPSRKKKVLIVDDTETNIDVLLESLDPQHEVSVALDGQTALDMVFKERPDIILLDVMMPGMDGWTVCRKLKGDESTKDIPIIFLTARGQVEDELHGFELGAVDYITKPFASIVVKARVNTHLELKGQRDYLSALSTLDGLTGIPNRRRFDTALNHEWQRAARSNSLLSLIMMDVDYFKPYNDHYGHAAGDECLKKVAGEGFRRVVHRVADLVARYGGEEFVCLLPDTDYDGACHVAEVFRANVERIRIPHEFSQIAPFVTLSLGVATLIPCMESKPVTLVEKADSQLYISKKSGRNRVTGVDFGKL
ncbi:MAG: diguanylate cyclase [Nitrospirae bacterium]|nr:diguanylate cyclase [Magnetococcales bacterium]HAT49636.1 diguanylate cyclase response regulator [Alphaproteobacteria bacterium]